MTWVIVGGGPTGSELAAEMHDLARSKEFNKAYPTLAPLVKIKLLDAAPAILTNFDKALSKYAAEKLKRDVSQSFVRFGTQWLMGRIWGFVGNRGVDIA